MLTAQQILSSKKCGDLFSSADKQVVIAEYREIARAYHPDISSDPQANEVMAKVNQLYEEALKLIESGAWEVSNRLILRDKLGKKYIGKYLKQFPFELGEAYIANSTVTYVFKENHKRFFDNAASQIKGLRYANKKMEEEMSRFMPRILYALSLDDGRFCLVLNKPEDVFLLSDIKDFFGGSLPDRHVAWIMSRLSNLNRVLYSAGLYDCRDIEMCFVSRTYFTRHGAGFFPTECSAKDLFGEDKQDATNVWNEFQGSFRYGYFEEDRFRNVCNQEFKRAKRMYPYAKLSFAFTHADETDGKVLESYSHKEIKDVISPLSPDCFYTSIGNTRQHVIETPLKTHRKSQ